MRSTLKDVAKLANVTPSVVSRLLNNDATLNIREETKNKIYWAVKELNYSPNNIARSLRTRITKLIGIIIPDIGNPTFGELVKGVQEAVYRDGYILVICNTEEDKEKEWELAQMLLEKRADGIFIASTYINTNITENLQNIGTPYVMVNRTIGSDKGYSVSTDNVLGASLLVKHLISLGHTKIAHIAGLLYTDTALGRLKGYRKTIMENNIAYNPDYVIETQFTLEGGYVAMRKLLDLNDPPTAVFAANDLIAIGALNAMKERKINVPNDISLAAFNNSWVVKQLTPPLTTIETNFFRMGYEGAKMLIQLINGKTPSVSNIVIEPKLIIGESTGPAKK